MTLPPGDAGTDCTIAAMKAVADHAAATSARVKLLAQHLLTKAPAYAHWQGVLLYDWLRANLTFSRDPAAIESVRSPDQLLAQIGRDGVARTDCANLATLAAAVGKRLGWRTAFITISRRPRPATMEHVFYGRLFASPNQLPFCFGENVRPTDLVPYDPQEGIEPGKMASPIARLRVYPA